MKISIFKIMALLLMALISNTALTSCGNDKDDEPKDDNLKERLQGTWHFTKMKIKCMGQTMELSRDELLSSSNADYLYDDVLTFNDDNVNGSHYEIDGNKLLLPYYVDANWWCQVSFSGSQLVLYYDIMQDGIRIEEWAYYNPGSRSGIVVPSEGNASFALPTSFSIVLK